MDAKFRYQWKNKYMEWRLQKRISSQQVEEIELQFIYLLKINDVNENLI